MKITVSSEVLILGNIEYLGETKLPFYLGAIH